MRSIRRRGPRANLIGKRFGKLIVASWSGSSRWLCNCDCGNSALIMTSNLQRGNSSSCGCVRNISSSKRATTHGLSGTLAYKTWCGIKARCLNPNHPSYKQYGGRGISIFEDWITDPVSFIDHVGQPPSSDHTLDRIDNTKGYEPGNVRWATAVEQANNKSNNRIVTWRGGTYTLAQLARKIALECGIPVKQFERAFSEQIHGSRREGRGNTQYPE